MLCKNIKKVAILVLRVIVYVVILLVLSSCKITSVDEEKINDLDYEVVEYHFMSEELRQIYDKAVFENKRLTYISGEEEYLIICYGEHPTTGYDIEIKELYETKNTIVADSTLIGPPKNIQVEDKGSYPALVIKIKTSNKTVIIK